MNRIMLLIIGMSLVTYLPRLIPFYLIKNENLNDNLELFCKSIPYATLGALIFPGVLSAIPNESTISIIALSVAGIISWKTNKLILSVFGSIIFVVLVLLAS